MSVRRICTLQKPQHIIMPPLLPFKTWAWNLAKPASTIQFQTCSLDPLIAASKSQRNIINQCHSKPKSPNSLCKLESKSNSAQQIHKAKCCACLLYRRPLSDMFLADMRLHMYVDLCTCMWVGGWGLAICVHVCGLGVGGWRFVYRYVGWGCLQYMYQMLARRNC